jgi:SAM-dependent methyltransferase
MPETTQMQRPAGTAGYTENADALAKQYESLAFEQIHRDLVALLPASPGRALDIGAGTGRDAAALARRGYQVVAIEPTPELRAVGQGLHADVAIDWIDDALPELATIGHREGRFDLVLLSAVWMISTPRSAVRQCCASGCWSRSTGWSLCPCGTDPFQQGG